MFEDRIFGKIVSASNDPEITLIAKVKGAPYMSF